MLYALVSNEQYPKGFFRREAWTKRVLRQSKIPNEIRKKAKTERKLMFGLVV